MGKILVIGSTNTDMVIRTTRFPNPGETLLGKGFFMFPGGKGANQAVAAARLGAHVCFVSRVGDDVFGKQALRGFDAEGLDTHAVCIDRSNPSGVALINVDDHGENTIVVAAGANGALSPNDLDVAKQHFQTADVVLAQLEIPIETVAYAAKLAAENKKIFILNPAPTQPLPDEILRQVSFLTPNESELEALTGDKPVNHKSISIAAEKLLEKGVRNVIVTIGSQGACICMRNHFAHVPGVIVKVTDTTAAGDVFSGALAVALSEGKPTERAVQFANAAAAISVTRMGAQASAPYRKEIMELNN